MFMVKIALEPIALFLAKTHLEVVVIDLEINKAVRAGTMVYSAITRYLRKRSYAVALNRSPKRPRSRTRIQLMVPFATRLTKSILLHFVSLLRGS
jgi:hypothetical protein